MSRDIEIIKRGVNWLLCQPWMPDDKRTVSALNRINDAILRIDGREKVVKKHMSIIRNNIIADFDAFVEESALDARLILSKRRTQTAYKQRKRVAEHLSGLGYKNTQIAWVMNKNNKTIEYYLNEPARNLKRQRNLERMRRRKANG